MVSSLLGLWDLDRRTGLPSACVKSFSVSTPFEPCCQGSLILRASILSDLDKCLTLGEEMWVQIKWPKVNGSERLR